MRTQCLGMVTGWGTTADDTPAGYQRPTGGGREEGEGETPRGGPLRQPPFARGASAHYAGHRAPGSACARQPRSTHVCTEPHRDLPSAPHLPASPRSVPRCTLPCSRAAGARASAVSQSLRGSAPSSQRVLAPIRLSFLCRRRWRRRRRHRKVPPVPPEAWAAPRCFHFEKFPPMSERGNLAVTSASSPLLRGRERRACAGAASGPPRSRPEVGNRLKESGQCETE